MAKFSGNIGYATDTDNGTGVWKEEYIVKHYRGDVIRNIRKLQTGVGLNDDINVSNVISIVADAFAMQHFHMMRYVEYMGSKWKVTDVEVDRPRLKLTIGGVYNAEETGTSSSS